MTKTPGVAMSRTGVGVETQIWTKSPKFVLLKCSYCPSSGLRPGELSEGSRCVHAAGMEPTSHVPATNRHAGCGARLELA